MEEGQGNKSTSVTLNELADEALRLSWVAIDFAPAGEEQSSDWGAAMEMYRALYDRFVQEFGEQAIKRVYLSAPHSGRSHFPSLGART